MCSAFEPLHVARVGNLRRACQSQVLLKFQLRQLQPAECADVSTAVVQSSLH